MNPTQQPRYCDYYGMLSYADFEALALAGKLADYTISAGIEKP